ncbi:MAG: serine hydrolase domain-containing protein [Candidatus Binataceae bacterium]
MTGLSRTAGIIEQGIAEKLHLGAQLYVSRDGATVADLAIGEASSGVAMRPDHLMLWMSSVKPVTAVAIGQMWEQGRLGLDDKVAQHIPEFGTQGKEPITIRHVMTHTGGFPRAVGPWTYDPWEKIVAQICASPLEPGWIPGRHCAYHVASGWYILGEIVRRLDGRPYHRYVREAIFEPLGMNDSWLGMPEERHREYRDRIVPMHFADGNAVPIPHMYPPFRESTEALANCRPGGNGRGPIRELGRFYEALLDGGRGVIRPQTIEALSTRHTVGMRDRMFNISLDRGLGFVVDSKHHGAGSAWYGSHCSPRTFGHSGYVSSSAFADPQHRVVVAIVFNGMLDASAAKHDARITAALNAVYEELGLAQPPA